MIDVLIVTDVPFWRRASGSHQRIFSLVRHLAASGFKTGVQFVRECIPPGNLSSELFAARVFMPVSTASEAGSIKYTLQSLREKARPFLRSMPYLRNSLRYLVSKWRRFFKKSSKADRRCAPTTTYKSKLIHDFISEPDIFVVCETINREQPKVVILEYLRTAYLLEHIRKLDGQPPVIMIDTIDIMNKQSASFQSKGLPS